MATDAGEQDDLARPSRCARFRVLPARSSAALLTFSPKSDPPGGGVSRGIPATGGELIMKRSRFKEEQIIAILKEAKAGEMPANAVCRKHDISEQTSYRWKSEFGGGEVSDAKRLKAIEEENRRLKTLVADLTLDDAALKGLLINVWSAPR
ncbi:transposase [Ferruginivarius sediminum]|uniref:Transposase n=1 Tax=Ferruginivarius sediminum TaxID=2661937 RepID=A0A369TDT4_9PROT|nr:transposase [Ferruginivarius sediminum]